MMPTDPAHRHPLPGQVRRGNARAAFRVLLAASAAWTAGDRASRSCPDAGARLRTSMPLQHRQRDHACGLAVESGHGARSSVVDIRAGRRAAQPSTQFACQHENQNYCFKNNDLALHLKARAGCCRGGVSILTHQCGPPDSARKLRDSRFNAAASMVPLRLPGQVRPSRRRMTLGEKRLPQRCRQARSGARCRDQAGAS